jgi:hypothetical protein
MKYSLYINKTLLITDAVIPKSKILNSTLKYLILSLLLNCSRISKAKPNAQGKIT